MAKIKLTKKKEKEIREDWGSALDDGPIALDFRALLCEIDTLRDCLGKYLLISPCQNGCDPKDMTCIANYAKKCLLIK